MNMSDRVYSLDPIPEYVGFTNSYTFGATNTPYQTRAQLLEEIEQLEQQINSMLSTNDALDMMSDLRVGSQMLSVTGNTATIRMYVDESINLNEAWSNTPHVLELDIPADEDIKFYRFRMD